MLCLSGCNSAGANGPESNGRKSGNNEAQRVPTATVAKRDLERTIERPGTVKGFETADLYAKVGGYLEQNFVDIGERVKEGDLLAKLHIPEMHKELAEKQAALESAEAAVQQAESGIRQAEAEVRSSKARLDEARTRLQGRQAQLDQQLAEYDRVKGLVERGSLQAKLLDEATYQRDAAHSALESARARIVTAQAEFETAEANVDRAVSERNSIRAKVKLAQAELEKVETMMEYSEIRAPFDGVITDRLFHRGAFIQPAQGNSAAKPLFSLARTDKVRISLDLPMGEVRWLNQGDRAVLDRVNVLPGQEFPGTVTRFTMSLGKVSRMMRVEVDLDNPEHQLLPGYYGIVTLLLDESPQTPVIPSSALNVEGNESFVYCVEGDICRKRIVTTNYQDGTIVGIASGLEGGEQIVVTGGGQLRDGQTVVAVNEDADA